MASFGIHTWVFSLNTIQFLKHNKTPKCNNLCQVIRYQTCIHRWIGVKIRFSKIACNINCIILPINKPPPPFTFWGLKRVLWSEKTVLFEYFNANSIFKLIYFAGRLYQLCWKLQSLSDQSGYISFHFSDLFPLLLSATHFYFGHFYTREPMKLWEINFLNRLTVWVCTYSIGYPYFY